MSRPIIKIHNSQTDEIIEREMNDEEYALFELDKQRELERQEQLKAKAEAKAQLLVKLGITENEAKLLLE